MKEKCEMFGCKEVASNALNIAPGTFVTVCGEHFNELEKEREHEDSNDKGIQRTSSSLDDLDE